MLLEFKFKNYRSFKDQQIFSMLAADNGSKETETSHSFQVNKKIEALRSAVIYGANASGKSNFIKAFQALRMLVVKSGYFIKDESIKFYDPFKFHLPSSEKPCEFEIDIAVEGIRYTYKVSFDATQIITESLEYYPRGRVALLYKRNRKDFEFGESLKGPKSMVASITNPNQLYLSKAVQNNMGQLSLLFQYFDSTLMALPFMDDPVDNYYTTEVAKLIRDAGENDPYVQNFKWLIQSFDTGILDFEIQKQGQELEIYAIHQVHDETGKQPSTVRYPLKEESRGTQKLFALGGVVLRALMKGRVLLVDEFERSLHPHICSFILEVFNDPEINTQNAQLILATHDTHLMSKDHQLGRDQVWIVEKDSKGQSTLFSLYDVEGVRKDIPYDKWYLSGRFGGVPLLKTLNFKLNYQPQ